MRGPPALGIIGCPVGVAALRDAIRHQHGVESTWIESVRWTEVYQGGEILFDGEIEVFTLDAHPTASRAYAWSYATEGARREIVAVLQIGPITDAVQALQSWLSAPENRRR